MFLLLLNRIFSNNVSIWVFSIILIILAIFLRRLYKKCLRQGKSLKVWRTLCFLPLAVALFHLAFFRIRGNVGSTRFYYQWFYIASLVPPFLALSSIWPKLHKIIHPLATLFCVFCGLLTIIRPMVWDSAMRNHTRESYTQSFVSTTHDMEKYYSLKDWKKIDIPALREKIMPLVQKSEETRDERLFAAAMMAYAHFFYDGHVRVNTSDWDTWADSLYLLSGHDYGMSMVRLSDGKVLAVKVDEESDAYKNGIREGSVMTSWNGVEINQAIEGVEFIYGWQTFPVKANEDLYKPALLATKGKRDDGKSGQYDFVEELLHNAEIKDDSERPTAIAGFIDENGSERQVELKAMGIRADRLEAAYIPLVWTACKKFPELKNLHTVMINQDTAYMARFMEQDNEFFDVLSYFTNKNPKVRKFLIDELTERKNEGMKKLIIDARGNQGGFWAEGVETASLFTKEPFEMARRGSELFGEPEMIHTVLVEADGRFSDIEVLLLVDMYCVSAGDSLARVLSQCPNVTVMGLTCSNCSCQETGGVSFFTDGICNIVYPVNWLYELDGRRYIDTDETRECTIPLDVQIPLTWELLQSFYKDFETRDVILDYALEYLNDK